MASGRRIEPYCVDSYCLIHTKNVPAFSKCLIRALDSFRGRGFQIAFYVDDTDSLTNHLESQLQG